MNKESIKFKGEFIIETFDNGKRVYKRAVKNLIVDAGLAGIASRLGANTEDPFTYLALGTGTTAASASDTALETEETGNGLARTNATVSQETTTKTNDTHVLTTTWTATGSVDISEVGMLNASSGGTLLGRQVFIAIPMISGREMQVTYKIICS